MSRFKDYYKILEVNKDTSDEVIKMAYKALIKKYHPDLNRDNIEFCNKIIVEINEAYSILSDREKRCAYNKEYDIYYDLNDSSNNKASHSKNYKSNNEDIIHSKNKGVRFSNKNKRKVFKNIAIGIIVILFLGAYAIKEYNELQVQKEKAIEIVKKNTGNSYYLVEAAEYEFDNPTIYEWEVSKVSEDVMFVSWNFDDNDSKEDGWYLYSFEVNLKDNKFSPVDGNDELEKKYKDLGYFD